MTKKLKFISLLLLITATTFAQKPQSIVNTTKSNVKDRVAVDTAKKPVTTTTQAKTEGQPITGALVKAGQNGKLVAIDSTKTSVTPTEQARTTAGGIIPGVGVIVKNKNDGGLGRVGTTNDKGEVIFTIKEKGDYTITLVNYAGGAAANNNNAAAMSRGNGVKGVKVGLGKNPTGKLIATNITNEKGEAEFKNLEVGEYKIVVQQADYGSGSPKAPGF